MANDSGGGEFVAGLVIGVFIGAAIALILAPQPGQETIAQIKDRGIELKERAADLSAEAMKRMEELQEKGRSALEQQRVRLQEAIQEGKDAANKRKEELMGRLEDRKRAGEAEA